MFIHYIYSIMLQYYIIIFIEIVMIITVVLKYIELHYYIWLPTYNITFWKFWKINRTACECRHGYFK